MTLYRGVDSQLGHLVVIVKVVVVVVWVVVEVAVKFAGEWTGKGAPMIRASYIPGSITAHCQAEACSMKELIGLEAARTFPTLIPSAASSQKSTIHTPTRHSKPPFALSPPRGRCTPEKSMRCFRRAGP